MTSQVPLELWHQLIGDPTYADAILDRLVHNATRIDLTGESPAAKAILSPANGLTGNEEEEQRESRLQRLSAGRHHPGTPGDIKSKWCARSPECLGDIVGVRNEQPREPGAAVRVGIPPEPDNLAAGTPEAIS